MFTRINSLMALSIFTAFSLNADETAPAGLSLEVNRCYSRDAQIETTLPTQICINTIHLEAPRYFQLTAKGRITTADGEKKVKFFEKKTSSEEVIRAEAILMENVDFSNAKYEVVMEKVNVEIEISQGALALKEISAATISYQDRYHGKKTVTVVEYK